MTVSNRDIVDEFTAHLAKGGAAQHTVESARLDLAQLVDFLGRQPIPRVGSEDLRGYCRWLEHQQGNGVSSQRRKIAMVKRLYRWLAANEFVREDPSAAIVYPALPTRRVVLLTRDESDAMVSITERPLWRVVLHVLIECGLKRDELIALLWDDLELVGPRPLVHVRRRRASANARHRTLALSADAVRAIQAVRAGEHDSDRPVPISARAIDAIVETSGRRAGVTRIPKVTPQILRDSLVARRLEGFARVEEAQPDRFARRSAVAEHDRIILRELGLSERNGIVGRVRRTLERVQDDVVEERALLHADL